MSLRVNTKKSYNSLQNQFIKFCSNYNIDPLAPLTEHQLCMAAADYCRTHKSTSLPTYISALSNWAEQYNLGPLPRFNQFKQVKKGLLNYFGLSETTQPKVAITLNDLAVICAHLDLSSFNDVRDWCCYIFGFFGLLRINETIGDQLTFSNVVRFDWGIQLTISYSKTSLQPVQVKLTQRQSDLFCPLLAYDRYVSFIKPKLRLPDSPFFRSIPDRTTSLTLASYTTSLKHRIQYHLLKQSSDYGTHSMRRGGTTALFAAGVNETIIAYHGRWKSLTYRQYYAWSTTTQLQPTEQLYLHSQSSSHQ